MVGHSKKVIYWSGHKVPIWPKIFPSLSPSCIFHPSHSAGNIPLFVELKGIYILKYFNIKEIENFFSKYILLGYKHLRKLTELIVILNYVYIIFLDMRMRYK